MINGLTAAYQAWKLVLVDESGLARDALHIHIGLAAFIVTRLAWRWRGGWIVAWLVALGFALGGEWFDWRNEAARGSAIILAAHLHDVWNTMLWPTVLALIGRWLEPKPAPPGSAPPSSDNAEQSFEQA